MTGIYTSLDWQVGLHFAHYMNEIIYVSVNWWGKYFQGNDRIKILLDKKKAKFLEATVPSQTVKCFLN